MWCLKPCALLHSCIIEENKEAECSETLSCTFGCVSHRIERLQDYRSVWVSFFIFKIHFIYFENWKHTHRHRPYLPLSGAGLLP